MPAGGSAGRGGGVGGHRAVSAAGLLVMCYIAGTQLPPLPETAGVLSKAVSWDWMLSQNCQKASACAFLPTKPPADPACMPAHRRIMVAAIATEQPPARLACGM